MAGLIVDAAPVRDAIVRACERAHRDPAGVELLEGGVRGDGVDQLRVREDLPDLAALELADEVPAERRPVLRLGLELLRAVLPQQVEAGVGEGAQLGDVEILDGGEQLDARGIAANPLARGGDAGADRARVDRQRHMTLALRPAASPSRR